MIPQAAGPGEVGRWIGGHVGRMDIADVWRILRADPADAPRADAHLETAEQGITTRLTQECVVALPRGVTPPSSHRNSDGPSATVLLAMWQSVLTSTAPDGSYHGPTQRLATASSPPQLSQVVVPFVVLPWASSVLMLQVITRPAH
jgi:hypothetical protein